jgi:methylated-DNA-protein-cysteine methyltransferase-like protein
MDKIFREDVYKLVSRIPKGRVMTYGQIALFCGHPYAARVVGQIAHFGPVGLPWHRVVNIKGGVASGFTPGGREGQARLLGSEKVVIDNNCLDLSKYVWRPHND